MPASMPAKGDEYTWRGTLARVAKLARDGSWAELRFTPRDGAGQPWGRRWNLPLPPTFRPAAEGRAPLTHMAYLPGDWLEAYADFIREDDPADPDERFIRGVRALLRMQAHPELTANPDDALEELARRRGQ